MDCTGQCCSNVQEAPPSKRTKCDKTVKVRKWDETYLKYGFFLPDDQILNAAPQPECLICSNRLSNSALVPAKLQRHLEANHPAYETKTISYFKHMKSSVRKQKDSFLGAVKTDQDLLLTSYRLSHYILKTKKPFTLGEEVIKPALQIVAEQLLDKKTEIKFQNIPLSDTTVSRRGFHMAEDLLEQLLYKIGKVPCYGLQLDESTDVGGRAQLLVFIRFPDADSYNIVDEYLCCLDLEVKTTAEQVFNKLNEFMTEKQIPWDKCCSLTTDGAAVMTGRFSGVGARVKAVAKNCVLKHCIIHREALAVKPLSSDKQRKTELESVLDIVVKTVNYIKCGGKGKSARVFQKLCEEMDSDNVTLLLHTEVRWLSRGKVLTRLFKLRREISVFLAEKNHEYATNFLDHEWVSKLAYLTSIFDVLSILNTSLQGKNLDIFSQVGKIDAFKRKMDYWTNKVSKNAFSSFRFLNEFLSEDSKIEDTSEIKELVLEHLKLLQKNFSRYFPEEESEAFRLLKWVVNPFIFTSPQQEELLDICNDIHLEEIFEKNGNEYFWIFLYKEETAIAKEALKLLCQFPNTYLCETAFSVLTTIKNKHRSCLKSVDMCMRNALSNEQPRFKKIAKEIQQQPSH